jgi:choline-sulfatase
VKRLAVLGFLLIAACSRDATRTPQRAPNVLLITIDTLRADRVGRGLTPAIDALAGRGTRYTNARATAPLTLPSHASIFTGTRPPEHGVRVNGVALAAEGRPTLARSFQGAGYRTGAFVGAYVLDRRFGLSRGFDIYDDRVTRDSSGTARLEAERRGDLVTTSAIEWLGRGGTQPFFAWIHLYDPHAPYAPPQEFLARGGDAYDGEVAFADAQVGRVLEWLRTSGEMDRTIVAVTSDHGEGLGDHGELTHGMLAYDSTLRVPLVMAGVGLKEGTVDVPVSLTELAGTLLRAAGIAVPAGMHQGPLTGNREAYAETHYPSAAGWHDLGVLAFDQWKLIVSSETELYDLSADPGETRNLAPQKTALVDGARKRLAELRAATSGSTAAVPADAAERLRALGYASGSAVTPSADAPNPARHIAGWNTFERELTRVSNGDARGALPGLTRLARAYPDAPVIQATYARAVKDTGRAAQAMEIYRRLVARWPSDAALYHDLAVAAAAAGLPAEAARAERAALALQPANAAASNGLGLLLVEQGNAAAAVEAFERAVADDPSNPTFWANLGNARRDAGDPARAEQAYRKALEHDPRSADAANGLGVLLVQQRRPGDAVRWFEQALAGSPRFVEARLNLGIAYQESGNREKAIEAYRRVLVDASPGSKEYRAATDLLGRL